MRKISNDELNRISIEDFKSSKKAPVVVVLDNIRSMHNVGSAFRTSDAFRVEKIYLTGITATPPHRDIQKAALGATESVSWEYIKKPEDAAIKLKEAGYMVYAVEQTDNSISLEAFQPKEDEKYALIFGNEVFGVSDEAISQCDGSLEIPQFGTKHSLNVSVSVGVVLWDLTCKLRIDL
jgi:tRNA G18 (ribose-2'-O)-methylase SpoU